MKHFEQMLLTLFHLPSSLDYPILYETLVTNFSVCIRAPVRVGQEHFLRDDRIVLLTCMCSVGKYGVGVPSWMEKTKTCTSTNTRTMYSVIISWQSFAGNKGRSIICLTFPSG